MGQVVPSLRPTSDEPSLLEIVISLDDFAQLVLGPLVAAVGVRMVALHQLLEAGLDLGAIGALGQVESLERLQLQWLQPAAFTVALGAPGKKCVRVLEPATQPVPVAAWRALPGVRACFPGRAMANDGVLLERLYIGRAPPFEVVVGSVELPHVIEAEQVVLAFASSPLRRTMQPGVLAALPLANR